MKLAGKAIACSLCAMITVGFISVSAKWMNAGYDTTEEGNYGKIYNEIVDGKSTSKQKVVPLEADDIVWKAEGFEFAYPHAGYDRLYLEGNRQEITRYNNTFAQWETRTKDYMWEMNYPYEIYQRQQTNIPGVGWVWDFYPQNESCVFSRTNRCAVVKIDFRNFGIADLMLDETRISDDVKDMYSTFLSTNIVPLEDRPLLSIDSLSELNSNGEYVVTDADIAANIEIITSEFITGPKLAGPAVRDVAKAYLENKSSGWKWDSDVVKVDYNAKIDWTTQQFEMDEPYYYYQYLIVNGMVMDGSNEKPRIVRRTGGKATPNITWKYAFAEADYPFSIVEAKYIDGKPALDLEGNPIYRIPTGKYANSTIKITSTDVELWISDANGGSYKVDSIPKVRGVVGPDPVGNAPGINFIDN